VDEWTSGVAGGKPTCRRFLEHAAIALRASASLRRAAIA
jgi:hypothetical protein